MADVNPQTQVLYAVGAACLSVGNLVDGLGRPHRSIAAALQRLVARGLVERREAGCFTASAAGKVLIDAGAEIPNGAPGTAQAPRAVVRGTFRQRAWRAICTQQGCFTIPAIAMLAARGEVDPESDLRKWFGALEAAGYLQRQAQREPGTAPSSNGCLRFRLVKNTGFDAPVHSIRHGLVRDPNTGEDIPCRK